MIVGVWLRHIHVRMGCGQSTPVFNFTNLYKLSLSLALATSIFLSWCLWNSSHVAIFQPIPYSIQSVLSTYMIKSSIIPHFSDGIKGGQWTLSKH